MLNTSGLLYLSARAMSAVGNLLAVIIFSRMAGPAEYGHYVFIYAWAMIAYGFSTQWMRFAYFGVYHLDRFGEYIASLARLLVAGLATGRTGSARHRIVRPVRAEFPCRGLRTGLRHGDL